MSKVKFYQYKKCSTCVKAAKFLDKNNINYDAVDITEQPPSIEELKKMLVIYGGNIRKLFNTSGVQYRELNIKEKINTITDAQAISMLSKNGKLVKRPFLIKGKSGRVGFKEEEWKAIFK